MGKCVLFIVISFIIFVFIIFVLMRTGSTLIAPLKEERTLMKFPGLSLCWMPARDRGAF